MRLTACIEVKQERGTVRRALESQTDVAEVKDILLKISARIEAFIVSPSLLHRVLWVLTVNGSTRAWSGSRSVWMTSSRCAIPLLHIIRESDNMLFQRLPSVEEQELGKELKRWVSLDFIQKSSLTLRVRQSEITQIIEKGECWLDQERSLSEDH